MQPNDQARRDRAARRELERTRADGETESERRERVERFDQRVARFRASQEVPF